MFEELEERFREVLARLRHEPLPAGRPPGVPPESGRIVRDVLDPAFLERAARRSRDRQRQTLDS
jgi:hypothetical protein